MPRTRHQFVNWARTHGCDPREYHQPGSEAELVALVRRAAMTREPLRAVGAMHSWNDIACTPGYLVNLDRLAAATPMRVDHARRRVTVSAGIRLRDLTARLADVGLALSNLGSIDAQSIAGAISTGTHGSGERFGNLATSVVALRMVTGTGEPVELSEDGPDPEAFAAARVGLGALGVITEVTVQCEPAFDLREVSVAVPFERAVRELDEIVAAHEHVKYWWLPHTDAVQVFAMDRTTRRRTRRSPLSRWLDEGPALERAFATLLRTGARYPALIPSCNRLVAALHFRPLDRIDRGDRLFRVPAIPRHREAEYAVDRAHAATAMTQTRELIEREKLRVNFIVEARFVARDHSLMSPAYGRASCQLGAYMAQSAGIEDYFRGFETRMLALGGRPHWGKEFSADAAALRGVFPRYDDFAAVRARLDPSGVFANDFVRRVFALDAGPRV